MQARSSARMRPGIVNSAHMSVWNRHIRAGTRLTSTGDTLRSTFSAPQKSPRSPLRTEVVNVAPPPLKPSESAQALITPASRKTTSRKLQGIEMTIVFKMWSQCSLDRLQAMLQRLVLLSATLVATWGAAQASILQAVASRWNPDAFASITASHPSVADELNRWMIYNMQKVPPLQSFQCIHVDLHELHRVCPCSLLCPRSPQHPQACNPAQAPRQHQTCNTAWRPSRVQLS